MLTQKKKKKKDLIKCIIVTFGEWCERFATARLHNFRIIRENKVPIRVRSPEEWNTSISILRYQQHNIRLDSD